MKKTKLFVCQGKSCRKKRKGDGGIDELAAELSIKMVKIGCQKVCDGPVVGLRVDGKLEWFERMRSGKALQSLETLLKTGAMDETLEKRRNRKRSGKLRR